MVFWFLCLWSVCLFGEAEPNFALSTFGGEPEGIVAGCVNPIAGEYFIKADDLVVTGARPIVLKRITQSRGAIKEHGRWHFVPHLKMTFVDDKRLIEGKDASGSALLFVRQVKKQKIAKIFVRDKLSHQYFIKQSFLRSVTNSSHGEISGRNHIQNYKIVKRKGKFTLFLGDGGERKYRKSKDKKHRKHYYLVREKFLNGDYLRYFYDNRDNLIRIESGHMGTKGIYAWVTFEDFGTYVRVDTSDKQVLFCRGEDYKFEGKEKRFLFNRFVHNQNKEGAEEVSYTTDGLALPLSYRLSSNHFHAIDYYHKGGNGLVLRPGSIDLKWDSMQRKRVLRLKSPVGNTRDLHVTHEFLYHNTLPRDWGVTDLLTPNGHCRAFRYEKATHRLGEVEFWDNFSGGSNNSRVRYSWNDLGYLLNKEILSPPTKRVSAISLEYDDKGNVTKETVHGDVIGNGEESAKVTRYEYGDHFRVKKITHPNGVVETLSYSGSDQITSRAMWHGKEVLKKTSYRYGVRN
ncbi:MAG: RHS repeat protein, partial [Simkaniaceae bacterium]|nr:RHS repeat protein [Simkaniaceae bacterium]